MTGRPANHNRSPKEINAALEFCRGHARAASRLLGIEERAISSAVRYHPELAKWRKARGFQSFRLPFRLDDTKADSEERKMLALIKQVDKAKLLTWLSRELASEATTV